MNTLFACLLGFIQGLTEFLPVSSSGHLVIVQHLVPGFSQSGVLFDVILHFGTVTAVLVFFRKKISDIFKKDRKYILYLVTGSVPVIIVGLLFRSQIEKLFDNLELVGLALIVTGALNLLTDKTKEVKKEISIKNSFLVGMAQAIAIIPGISRSGSTIFVGSALGIKKEKVAEFSFLLSLPAVLGANLLEFVKYWPSGVYNFGNYLLGFGTAFISGFFAIGFALRFLKEGKFKIFSFYCLFAGLVTLILL